MWSHKNAIYKVPLKLVNGFLTIAESGFVIIEVRSRKQNIPFHWMNYVFSSACKFLDVNLKCLYQGSLSVVFVLIVYLRERLFFCRKVCQFGICFQSYQVLPKIWVNSVKKRRLHMFLSVINPACMQSLYIYAK